MAAQGAYTLPRAPLVPPAIAAMASPSTTTREKRNWLIHQLYVRQEFDECLDVIEQALLENRAQCEYPIYVKGLNTCNDIKFDSTD
jgi:Bardet-Biedl syndrome 4 protein